MGANNLYFPSIGQTKSIKAKNYMVVDNERTGQPYKIYIEDFVSSLLSEGILVVEDELTADELAAVNGANSPTALNPFATISDIPTLTSELTNDSGFLTANLYTSNGTLTANRIVTGGGYSLTFNTISSALFQSNTDNDLTYSANFTTQRTASGTFAGFVTHNDNGNQAKVTMRAGSSGVGFLDSKDRLVINANWDGNNNNVGGYSGGAVNSIVVGNVFSNGNVGIGWNPNVSIPYRLTVNGTLGTISPSASSLDTAFAVRNNTDTASLLNIQGNGRADFYGDIYARSEKVYLQDLWSLYFNYNAIQITSGITYNSRGEVGVAYTQHDFKTESLITTAGCYLMKIRNFNTLHYSMNKDGVENRPTMPTYADNASALVGGLIVGDEYKTATGERRIVV